MKEKLHGNCYFQKVIFKILDQEDVEAHEKSREVSNRRVGS